MSHGRHTTMVIIGGWSMVIFSILFVGITLLIDSLAQAQQMLYGLEQHNLFKVAAGSNTIRTLLVVYAILPLLIIPGAVGAFYIFSDKYEANMRCGLFFAAAGAFALTLSLLMLPSINWHLATYINTLPAAQQGMMIILLQSFHTYFGVYVGDIMGFGCLLVWFFISSIIMIKTDHMPHIVGIIQLVLAICAALILTVRYTGLVPDIHVNVQAPGIFALWIFIYGIALISLRKD
ncbi:MAG: hypothetical protein A3F14_00265 [Gammaproteobacteria bacterium RIFCSPHIGHO2_12_FULL_43_28]|nr:MAG: hypothetical protein A3F14_00265 [Gammaproteobacteria bacterium RIFCSPHIGHO2_12_FULL_43_28]